MYGHQYVTLIVAPHQPASGELELSRGHRLVEARASLWLTL